ncbi:hypothetical protein AA15669_1798 [Saccharibacter floricola DSM 15669]|uniref:RteC protein n=2 Tax=Saccharibacter TaxID=231052 RepID=A0ABQ0P160_9PROT|nr:hypothetical protein AA15669_1798 [Saccharibacter floricola DSM 15669]
MDIYDALDDYQDGMNKLRKCIEILSKVDKHYEYIDTYTSLRFLVDAIQDLIYNFDYIYSDMEGLVKKYCLKTGQTHKSIFDFYNTCIFSRNKEEVMYDNHLLLIEYMEKTVDDVMKKYHVYDKMNFKGVSEEYKNLSYNFYIAVESFHQCVKRNEADFLALTVRDVMFCSKKIGNFIEKTYQRISLYFVYMVSFRENNQNRYTYREAYEAYEKKYY